MEIPQFKFGKRALPCLLLAIASAAATTGLANNRFFQSVRLKVEDLHFHWRGALPTRNIVILGIDQNTLETFADPRIFWHGYYAEAIRAAAAGGAKVMALDVAFGIPVGKWEPQADQVLAEAVLNAIPTMPVVCGYIPELATRQQVWPVPVNLAASAMGLSGFVNLTVDPDDFVRQQQLFEQGVAAGQPIAHSFALRVAEKFAGTEAQAADGKLTVAGYPVPLTPERWLRINFAGPAGTFPRVSFAEFLRAARAGNFSQIREWVRGKIVLVGVDSVEDRYPTPFFSLLGGNKWNTAGVEIHASTIETLLNRSFLVPAPNSYSFLIIMAVALIAAILTLYFPVWQTFVLLTAFLGAAIAGTQFAFNRGTTLPTLEILVSASIAFLGSSIYRFFVAERRGQFFKMAIGAFVGRHVASSLEDASEISMLGSRHMVTILFSDIRGFTAFCEGQDPATVVKLLNEYFSRMVSIITSHGGHVNKFIGDGILAIFSDDDGPLLSDHALRSIRCGTAMLAAEKPPFKTGIGIHTGPVIIGNIGSAEKLEYTALGDTVNLASRLESLNKEYQTQLLMSGATWERLGLKVESRRIGSVPVRGVALPVDIYTVEMFERTAVARGAGR